MATDTIALSVVDPSEVWGTDLRMRLPSADDDAIDREVANCIQEFLQKSSSLALELYIDIEPGVNHYSFKDIPTTHTPSSAVFGGLEGLYCHSVQETKGGSYLQLSDHAPRNISSTQSTPVVVWNSGLPGGFHVFPTPPDAMLGYKFKCLITAMMKRPITTVPAVLASWNYSAILDGATGRMMGHPKRPYSDPRLAEYYLRRFRNEMRVATDEAKRGWINAESSFLYNQDWSRKTQLRHP